MKTPTTGLLLETCELAAHDLPKAILSVLERSDALLEAMRCARKPPPHYIRISSETLRDLRGWAQRKLDCRQSAFSWRGRPIIGPHATPPSQQSMAA